MILLASDIAGQEESYFGTLPMTVRRNAYGRQLGSFHTTANANGIGEISMTFIRAPYVESVHADAAGEKPEVLSVVQDRIVGVKYHNQMAFAFHPELDQDTKINNLVHSLTKQLTYWQNRRDQNHITYVPNPVCFSFYLQHFYSLLCLCRSFISSTPSTSYYAAAFALILSITLLIPIHTVISLKISTTLP